MLECQVRKGDFHQVRLAHDHFQVGDCRVRSLRDVFLCQRRTIHPLPVTGLLLHHGDHPRYRLLQPPGVLGVSGLHHASGEDVAEDGDPWVLLVVDAIAHPVVGMPVGIDQVSDRPAECRPDFTNLVPGQGREMARVYHQDGPVSGDGNRVACDNITVGLGRDERKYPVRHPHGLVPWAQELRLHRWHDSCLSGIYI